MPESTSTTRWTLVKVEQLAANAKNALAMGPFGSRITKDNFVETGVPVIRGTNLSKGRFYHQDFVFISEVKADELAASNAFADDLVFTHRGTLGQVGIIPKGYYPRYVVSQSQMKLTCDQTKVLPMFLYYYFRSELGQHELLSHTGGSGVPAISSPLTTLRNAAIYLPPLPTQRKIAAILSAYDDLIENNTRRIGILEEMAQSFYREWFVHFRFPGHEKKRLVESALGLIPEGWEVVTVGDISTLYRGRSYTGTDITTVNGLPFLNLKCIERDGGFRYDGIKRYQGPYKEAQTTQAGDIIMAVTDMTQERRLVARAARVPATGEAKFVFSMDLVKIAPQDESYRDYLYGMFRFSSFPDEVKQYANGANVLHLSPERIENFLFPLAPEALCTKYSAICSDMYKACDILHAKNANLRRTRDLLLPKLISGEVDVEGLDIHVEGGNLMITHRQNEKDWGLLAMLKVELDVYR